jgi:hypothetical protein
MQFPKDNEHNPREIGVSFLLMKNKKKEEDEEMKEIDE